jgi:hypothetical protein
VLRRGAAKSPPEPLPASTKIIPNFKAGELIVKRIEIEERLCNFIRDFGDDLSSLELLLFFSRHPNARFNRTVLLHVHITSGKFDTGIALKRLLDKKIVISHCQNGITLYSLTKDEPTHTLSSELINIDQRQWQKIVEQILDSQDNP